MQKRGQITLFVIIGLVIIILVGLFFYFRSSYIIDKPPTDLPDEVSQEFGHIQKFVQTCIYEVGKEAVLRLGQQGGYIDPANAGIMTVPGFPTTANGFEFAEGSGFTIPYWYYMSSANSCEQNCQFDSKKPLLTGNSPNSIQSQITNYVEANIPTCFKEFKDFKALGFDVTESDDLTIKTTIGEETVTLQLNHELHIEQADASGKIRIFTAELDVKLKQLYELGTKIRDYASDNETKFLEFMTKETISLGSMGGDGFIPPMSGTEINPKKHKTWMLNDVKENLQMLLMTDIPTLQVMFSRNSNYFATEDPYIDATYNNRIILLEEDPLKIDQFVVNFVYLGWWPIYVDIDPGNQLIKPNFIGWDTKFFNLGMDIYDFQYDVSYPVLVVLEDEMAFQEEGFILQYGLEANLRNNYPMVGQEYNELLDIPEDDNITIDFCGLEQRNSGNIVIKTSNALSNEPIKDVSLSFHCFDQTCILPSTSMNGATTKLPPCLGGVVTAFKSGYSSANVPLSTTLDSTANLEIALFKEKEFNITVKKNLLQKVQQQWLFLESSSDLDDDDEVFMIFERIKAENEPDYVKLISIEGLEIETLSLVPGNYTVEATLMRNLGPGHNPETITFAAPEIDDVEMEDMVFNESFLLGGLSFGENNTFELTPEDYNKNNIQFKLVALDINSLATFNDMSQMDAYTDYSISKRTFLEPIIE